MPNECWDDIPPITSTTLGLISPASPHRSWQQTIRGEERVGNHLGRARTSTSCRTCNTCRLMPSSAHTDGSCTSSLHRLFANVVGQPLEVYKQNMGIAEQSHTRIRSEVQYKGRKLSGKPMLIDEQRRGDFEILGERCISHEEKEWRKSEATPTNEYCATENRKLGHTRERRDEEGRGKSQTATICNRTCWVIGGHGDGPSTSSTASIGSRCTVWIAVRAVRAVKASCWSPATKR